jgi:uncharacterized protein YqhQ
MPITTIFTSNKMAKHPSTKRQNIGGQAVIEGVMMKSPTKVAIAVRKPDGTILVQKKKETPWTRRNKLLRIPVVRGAVSLIEMLVVGMRTLNWSAEQQATKKEEKIKGWEIGLAMLFAILLAVGLFIVLPFYLAKIFIATRGFSFNLLDGVFRAAVFVGYLVIIGRFADIKRTFQYHGAEHKAVHCYEAGKSLTPKNVKRFAKEHLRCGTSFFAIVIVIAIVVFSLIKTQSTLFNIAARIVVMPLIAGISYEVLKLSSRYHRNPLFRLIAAPGIAIQKLTTAEPSGRQIEVAIAALKAAV